MGSLNYISTLRSHCSDRINPKRGSMDKRLAGLSFLLTLGWVTAVGFVMWFFSR